MTSSDAAIDQEARLQAAEHVAGLYRAVCDHVEAIRRGASQDVVLTEMALAGAISAYLRHDVVDLSAVHVLRIACRLARAHDVTNIANNGRDPDASWRALAREAIRLGAVVPKEDP